jgi:DNA modification methylase
MPKAKDKIRVRVKELKMVLASKLVPSPKNFRRHTDGQRAALNGILEEVGFAGAVVTRQLDDGRFEIIDGHLRADVGGDEEIPIVVTDLSDAEADKVLATYDAIGGMAEIDVPSLEKLVDDLHFENVSLDEMITEVISAAAPILPESPFSGEGSDTVPSAYPEKPVTSDGDVWLLGGHRLVCGDCSRGDRLSSLLVGEKYDLLITDPPYGVSYADKNRFLNVVAPANRIQKPIQHDHSTPEEMSSFWNKTFFSVRRFASPGASYYVTGPQGGDLLLLLQALSHAKFPLRHMLIWKKNNHVLGRSDYHYKHEPIIYGWVEGASHRWYGDSSQMSVWEIDKPHASKLHPTMKPLVLYERAIVNSSKTGDVVCDPFAGSGTALIASENLSRRCFAMEIDPGYCDVSIKRWAQHTGRDPMRESDGATWSSLSVNHARS